MILLSMILACGEKDTENTDSSILDTSVSESVDTSIEQYKTIYCDEYAMRCNAYDAVEDCEAMFDRWFSPDCEIVDKETFDVCVDWLLSLDCSFEGWIDECDQFYSCPE